MDRKSNSFHPISISFPQLCFEQRWRGNALGYVFLVQHQHINLNFLFHHGLQSLLDRIHFDYVSHHQIADSNPVLLLIQCETMLKSPWLGHRSL